MRRLGLVVPFLVASCVTPRSGGGHELQPPVKDVPSFAERSCHADAPEGLAECVEADRIAEDLRALAGPRPPGSEGHRAARRLCHERLAELGYEVEEHRYDGGVNVIGRKIGLTTPEERVLISAHYDGVAGCAAADDNASGVAVLLEVARVLEHARVSRTLEIACWDGGERGQEGSAAYAAEVDGVEGMISLESVGYADPAPDSQRIPDRFHEIFPDQALAMLENEDRANFLTIVADGRTETWADNVAEAGAALGVPVYVLPLTPAVKQKQRKMHRSDHVSFWEEGSPAMLFTDTGPFRNPRHHCEGGEDAPRHLSHDFAAQVARLVLHAAGARLELRSPTQRHAR